MRRIAADKGVHVSIGEQHQVAEESEFVPGPSMTSRMLICMLSQHGDVLLPGAAGHWVKTTRRWTRCEAVSARCTDVSKWDCCIDGHDALFRVVWIAES